MGSLGSRVRVHIGIPAVRTDGLRAAYGHVITKFFVMGRFTYPGAPLLGFARGAPLRMYGMHRTRFDHACLDLLLPVI